MISTLKHNFGQTILSELPNLPTEFNFHYHRLEIKLLTDQCDSTNPRHMT